MPFDATVYKVMLASPGDVAKIRPRVEKAVNDWNGLHSEERGVVLLPILWEKHATPQLGGRPQELINEELVRPSDILIAVFSARLGQATGKAESGTVEEIGEFLAAEKPVLLYFSKAAIQRPGFDASQYEKLEAYRAKVRQLGTYGEFSSPSDLENQLARHLLNTMRRIHPGTGRRSPDSAATDTGDGPASDAERASAPTIPDPTFGGTIGERRAKVLCDIVGAYLSTSDDDRVPIKGRGGDGGSMLLHPGFSGRNPTVSIDDLRALHDVRLIRMRSTGGAGDCELTPLRMGIEFCRLRTAGKPAAATEVPAIGGTETGEAVRRPMDVPETLPTHGAAAEPTRLPPTDLQWRDVNALPGAQRQQKACLSLRSVELKSDRNGANLARPRVFNEGLHEAWDVKAVVANADKESWRPAGTLTEIGPKKEGRLEFPYTAQPIQDPPVSERHEFRLRLTYRDGLSVDNLIEYGIVIEGIHGNQRIHILRDNTVVDPLCPAQQSGIERTKEPGAGSNLVIPNRQSTHRADSAREALNLALGEIRRARGVAKEPSTGRQWLTLGHESLRRAASHLDGEDQEAVDLLIDAIDLYNAVIGDANRHRGSKDGWMSGIRPLADKVLELTGPAEEAITRSLTQEET